MKIQEGSLKQPPSLGSVNVRIVFSQQSNRALSVMFMEAFLLRIFTHGERVDLIYTVMQLRKFNKRRKVLQRRSYNFSLQLSLLCFLLLCQFFHP